jgi:DNA-binding NarL/FixJ family response regulator
MAEERSDRPAVVLVDDDMGVLAALKRLLRDEPFDVLATTSPLEALGWLSQKEVRVVMVDERMPEMSGSELLEWVRARFPEMPSVILTGYSGTALVVEEKHLRIERLVTKPWDDENLRELLRDLAGFGREAPEPAGCRVDCTGKTDLEVLLEILPEMTLARESGRELAIEVLHLSQLQGPIARLLLSLIRLSGDQHVRLILRDASGLAAVAVRAIKGAAPFIAAAGAGEVRK